MASTPAAPRPDTEISNPLGDAWIYVFSAAHGVKVGVTRGPVEKRRHGLELTVGLPITFEGAWECRDRNLHMVEAAAFERLAEHRLLGEWFSCSPAAACAAVAQILDEVPPAAEQERGHGGRPPSLQRGVALRDVRKAAWLSLRDVEEQTGINRAIWSQIETGRMLPEPQHIAALSRVLQVPYEQWRLRFVLELEEPS